MGVDRLKPAGFRVAAIPQASQHIASPPSCKRIASLTIRPTIYDLLVWALAFGRIIVEFGSSRADSDGILRANRSAGYPMTNASPSPADLLLVNGRIATQEAKQ